MMYKHRMREISDTHNRATMLSNIEVAAVIPCHNEQATIGQVIRSIHENVPGAEIYVYDNNSADNTVEIARAAGGVVRKVTNTGKGYVVRRMFADVDADVYLLVDGDNTYDLPSAPKMIELLLHENLDMVVGARAHE